MGGIMEQTCLPDFQRAAAAAASFELKLRLLCDLRPETADKSLDNLDLVRKEVIRAYGQLLDADTQSHLKACVDLRNKLLHQQLSRVSGKLVTLGEELRSAGLWSVDLTTGEATETERVSTKNGKIYGWMLTSKAQGAFDAAVRVFDQGYKILDAIMEPAAGTPIPPR